MPRPLTTRKPTLAEFRRLNHLAEEVATPRQRRRAKALILHYAGMSAQDIAQALEVHPNTIYGDLRAFAQRGLSSVTERVAMGAPPRLRPQQTETIARLAETLPAELGLPWGRWSLATLRQYVIGQHIVRRISRERLRQVLQKKGSFCAASGAR